MQISKRLWPSTRTPRQLAGLPFSYAVGYRGTQIPHNLALSLGGFEPRQFAGLGLISRSYTNWYWIVGYLGSIDHALRVGLAHTPLLPAVALEGAESLFAKCGAADDLGANGFGCAGRGDQVQGGDVDLQIIKI